MKSDLEIALYISRQLGRGVSASELRAFIGADADRRISALRHAHIIKGGPSWFSDQEARYELDSLGVDLVATESTRKQEVAEQRAYDYRKQQAQRAQMILDKKKDYRHDVKIAAFTVILTLFLEHLPQIIDFIQTTLKSVFSH